MGVYLKTVGLDPMQERGLKMDRTRYFLAVLLAVLGGLALGVAILNYGSHDTTVLRTNFGLSVANATLVTFLCVVLTMEEDRLMPWYAVSATAWIGASLLYADTLLCITPWMQ